MTLVFPDLSLCLPVIYPVQVFSSVSPFLQDGILIWLLQDQYLTDHEMSETFLVGASICKKEGQGEGPPTSKSKL